MDKRPGEKEIVPTTTENQDPEHFGSQTGTEKPPTEGCTSDGEQETTKERSTVDSPSEAENHRPEDRKQASRTDSGTSEPQLIETGVSTSTEEPSTERAAESSQESLEGAEVRSASEEDADLRAKIAGCVEKATKRKASFSQYDKEGYDIAREIAALDEEPPKARDAYFQTLFGKKDDPLASVYRRVGRCDFLYEHETVEVLGYMPIHVAVLLARKNKKPKLQRAVLDYYRNRRDQMPTKNGLAEVIRSLDEPKQVKEKVGAKQESSRQMLEGSWAIMTFTPDRPLNEWRFENEAIALLQQTEREAVKLGLKANTVIHTVDSTRQE